MPMHCEKDIMLTWRSDSIGLGHEASAVACLYLPDSSDLQPGRRKGTLT